MFIRFTRQGVVTMKMKLLSAAVLAAGLFSATAAVQAATLVFTAESEDFWFHDRADTHTVYFRVVNADDSSGVTLTTPSFEGMSDRQFLLSLVVKDPLGNVIGDGAMDPWSSTDDFPIAGVSINLGYQADGIYSFTVGNVIPSFSTGSGTWPVGWGNGDWKVTVTGAFSSAVPEPETWAMLLVGLGMVGAVARRRKQR